MNTAGSSRSGVVRYRYRSGDTLSGWMSSEELRAHVAAGRITAESFIQQIRKHNWVAAAKVPGLWAAAGTPGGFGGVSGSGGTTNSGDLASDGSSGSSADGAGGEATEAGGGGGPGGVAGPGGHHPHHARLAESMQHLLQRALLGTITVSSADCDQPHRAILAGVTVDSIALKFEACSSVVLVPWSRIRSIMLPAENAHSTARIRAKAEVLVIEVEHLPMSVVQAAEPA